MSTSPAKRATSPAGGPRGKFKGSSPQRRSKSPTGGRRPGSKEGGALKSRPRTRDGPPNWDDDGGENDPDDDGGVMVRLAVIPSETRRNESRQNQPFDVARGREERERRPKSTSKGFRDLLRPLPVADEVAAASHGLQNAEAWATTFLREDSGCPPAKFVYSMEARVRKWDLLRHLHGVIYGSGPTRLGGYRPRKKAIYELTKEEQAAQAAAEAKAAADEAARYAALSPTAKLHGGASDKPFVHPHHVDVSTRSYRGVSVESALWYKAATDGAVAQDVFVEALVGRFRFDPALRMEGRLRRLYKCFEGAESNKVDYREVAACLRVLEDGKSLPEGSRQMLLRFYDLWASEQEFEDDNGAPQAVSIPTTHCMRLMGLGAESDRDLALTRGRFQALLAEAAPGFGLKPTTGVVPRGLFVEILDRWPALVEAWREACWNRLTDDMRLSYLQREETAVAERFGYLDQKMKMKKAMEMFQGSLAKKTWAKWLNFYKFYKEQNNRRLYILYRKARKSMVHWHHWGMDAAKRRMLREVANAMGKLNGVRYPFGRWKRWVHNIKVVAYSTVKFSPMFARVAEGVSHLRIAARAGELRIALTKWREETCYEANWEYAIKYCTIMTLRLHLRAWRRHVDGRKAIYARENEAREAQKKMRDMLAEFERMDNAEALAGEELAAAQAKAAEDKRVTEKNNAMYWVQQRRKADKALSDKYILDNQRDEQLKVRRAQREAWKRKFDAKWHRKEFEIVMAAREKRRAWIKNRGESRVQVDKRFAELRKEFEDPPGPQNVERERQINLLANVFIIYLEMTLFKKNVVMRDFVLSFDGDGDGFIQHHEFMQLVNQVEGLILTADQVREIKEALDHDGDGNISPDEFEEQARMVEQYCGQDGSPWKTYVDPHAHMLCYHHLQTRERVFDFEMTTAKLKEINELNLVAEADRNARLEAHRMRDEDWKHEVRVYAARKIQKMRQDRIERDLLNKLRFRYRKRIAARGEDKESRAASRIAAAYRGKCARRGPIKKLVAKAFAKKHVKDTKGLVVNGQLLTKGTVYYMQVNNKLLFLKRPRLHKRYFPKADW